MKFVSLTTLGTGLLFISLQTQASAQLWGGVGIISEKAGRVTNSNDASASLIGTLVPIVAIHANVPLMSKFGISPMVSYTPIGRGPGDGGSRTTMLPMTVRLSYSVEPVLICFGAGYLIYTISGSGGTKQLNNGTSTTTFGLPSGSKSSNSFIFDLAVGYTMDRFRFDVDTIAEDIASSTRRAFDIQVLVSYSLLGGK